MAPDGRSGLICPSLKIGRTPLPGDRPGDTITPLQLSCDTVLLPDGGMAIGVDPDKFGKAPGSPTPGPGPGPDDKNATGTGNPTTPAPGAPKEPIKRPPPANPADLKKGKFGGLIREDGRTYFDQLVCPRGIEDPTDPSCDFMTRFKVDDEGWSYYGYPGQLMCPPGVQDTTSEQCRLMTPADTKTPTPTTPGPDDKNTTDTGTPTGKTPPPLIGPVIPNPGAGTTNTTGPTTTGQPPIEGPLIPDPTTPGATGGPTTTIPDPGAGTTNTTDIDPDSCTDMGMVFDDEAEEGEDPCVPCPTDPNDPEFDRLFDEDVCPEPIDTTDTELPTDDEGDDDEDLLAPPPAPDEGQTFGETPPADDECDSEVEDC